MFGDPLTNPKKWPVFAFPEICSSKKNAIKAGPFGSALKKEFYVEKGYKIYGQEQVIKNDFEFGNYYISEEKYKELENYSISSGDLLISLVGTYGKVSIVPEQFEPGIINPRLMKITLNQHLVRPEYIKLLFESNSFKSLLGEISHGGTMGILNVGLIKQLILPVPPIEVQNNFVKFQLKTNELYISQINSLQHLESNFQALLQKAFKGELKVKDGVEV